MSKDEHLLLRLLHRGDEVGLVGGRLVIKPASGLSVCPVWLAAHSDSLIRQILSVSGSCGFQYVSYSTGHYGKKRGAGITLQFVNLLSGESAYTVFNMELTRKRKSKNGEVGSALPKGQFRPPKRGYFIPFWRKSGLTMPARLGSFHDYMGNLKPIVFTGQFSKGERLESKSIVPLSLSSNQLKSRLIPDFSQTTPVQHPDNSHTCQPYSESAPAPIIRGEAENLTAGANNDGKRLSGSQVSRVSFSPLDYPKNQTTQQWLEAYGEED